MFFPFWSQTLGGRTKASVRTKSGLLAVAVIEASPCDGGPCVRPLSDGGCRGGGKIAFLDALRSIGWAAGRCSAQLTQLDDRRFYVQTEPAPSEDRRARQTRRKPAGNAAHGLILDEHSADIEPVVLGDACAPHR